MTSDNRTYCGKLANASSAPIKINTKDVLHLHVVSTDGYPKFHMHYNVVPASVTGITFVFFLKSES